MLPSPNVFSGAGSIGAKLKWHCTKTTMAQIPSAHYTGTVFLNQENEYPAHGFLKVEIFSTRIAQVGEWREKSLKIREIRPFASFAFYSLGFVKRL